MSESRHSVHSVSGQRQNLGKGRNNTLSMGDRILLGSASSVPLTCPAAYIRGFPGGSEVKVSAYSVGDPGLIPG